MYATGFANESATAAARTPFAVAAALELQRRRTLSHDEARLVDAKLVAKSAAVAQKRTALGREVCLDVGAAYSDAKLHLIAAAGMPKPDDTTLALSILL